MAIALAKSGTGPVLAIGPTDVFDQTCYKDSNYTTAVVNLAADAAKEQKQIAIALAGIAVSRQLPLVTRNRRGFGELRRSSGAPLRLLDWSA